MAQTSKDALVGESLGRDVFGVGGDGGGLRLVGDALFVVAIGVHGCGWSRVAPMMRNSLFRYQYS